MTEIVERVPSNALTLAEYEDLSRQAAWVSRWNASRPALHLSAIPWAKGPAPAIRECPS